jgi:hypothetical protein
VLSKLPGRSLLGIKKEGHSRLVCYSLRDGLGSVQSLRGGQEKTKYKSKAFTCAQVVQIATRKWKEKKNIEQISLLLSVRDNI